MEYFIVLYEGDWHIRFNDKHFGPLRTEREAIEVATIVAKRAAGQGLAATVLTQDFGGAFRQTWPTPTDAASALRIPSLHAEDRPGEDAPGDRRAKR